MRTLAAALLLTFGLTLQATPPVPRPSPELIIHELPGKDTAVSSLKGKVVIIQVLFTDCPHCQAAAKWLSNMQTEMGPKGLAIYGIAINDLVLTPDPKLNLTNVEKFKAIGHYPVGVAKTAEALKYLGISVMEPNWGVPQFVVLDKKGVIRAQTSPRPMVGEVSTESAMRAIVTKLLAEK
ncbi:MAG: TlpA disulfide reductase family protein [Acidobacteriota bacterium]